ncbi:MAG: ATP-grasp domain-containing protein [Acidimicrobiales bacterium]
MNRIELRDAVSDALGNRRLVWVGTRGDDAESIVDLPQFEAAYSVIAAMDSRTATRSASLEQITGARPDLDVYDLDADQRLEAVDQLRSELLRSLSRPSAMFTYRPSQFTTGVAFSRLDKCRYLGMFHAHQSAFEHKPWVESSLDEIEVPRIPWRYVADRDQIDARRLLDDGPVMLRRSRTTGGVGLYRVDDPSDVERLWPSDREAFVSVAPYLEGGVPVNIGAVAWDDGVTVHPASVQLIGIPSCTVRPFGYCGNDFGAMRQFDPETLDVLQESTVRIGGWLRRLGYRGAFGVDFLVIDGTPFFTEVNPRFQGSTHASSQFSVERDESCLLLEHLAAFLRLPAPPSHTVRRLAQEVGAFAHVVVHHTGDDGHIDPRGLIERVRQVPGFDRVDVATAPQILTERGATVARLTVRDRVTETGFELLDPIATAIADWVAGRSDEA